MKKSITTIIISIVLTLITGCSEEKKIPSEQSGSQAKGTSEFFVPKPSPDELVLPPRNDYLMEQKPVFVKSAHNAQSFAISDDRLEYVTAGYKLKNPADAGYVLSNKISLPGEEMKISCDVTSGSVTVSLFDADGKLLGTSKPVTGGMKIREVVKWLDDFALKDYVAMPVTVKFDIEGDAKLYGIRFDILFWY